MATYEEALALLSNLSTVVNADTANNPNSKDYFLSRIADARIIQMSTLYEALDQYSSELASSVILTLDNPWADLLLLQHYDVTKNIAKDYKRLRENIVARAAEAEALLNRKMPAISAQGSGVNKYGLSFGNSLLSSAIAFVAIPVLCLFTFFGLKKMLTNDTGNTETVPLNDTSPTTIIIPNSNKEELDANTAEERVSKE